MLRSKATPLAIKGVTFVPIAALIYYADYGNWVNYLISNHAVDFFVGALAMLGIGAWLKRDILETYVQVSRSSVPLGFIALAASLGIYVYGSFFFLEPVLHFESLILLAISYILFRSDVRIVRLLAPLLALLGVAFAAAPIINLLSIGLSLVHTLRFLADLLPPVIVAFVMLGLFASYTDPWYANRSLRILISNASPKSLIVPGLITLVELLYWFIPQGWFLIFLVPAPALLLLFPKQRRQFELPRAASPFAHRRHLESVGKDGFCLICGEKFSEYKTSSSSGLVGLVLIIVILAALLLIQIPILTISGGTPYDSVYTYSGAASTQIPFAPAGWLINSTTVLNYPEDSYVARQVYVPAYHPETKNYTLYYELATASPYVVNNFWNHLNGWSRSSQPYQLDQFVGSLYTFTSNSTTMMAFAGSTQMTFYDNSNFERLAVGLSVVREFVQTNASSASTQFQSDLRSSFASTLDLQNSHSTNTDFFQRASQTLSQLGALLMTAVASLAIMMGTYSIKRYDSSLDGYLSRASEVNDGEWQVFSALLKTPKLGDTAIEIANVAHAKITNEEALVNVLRTLQNLERRKLVKTDLDEKGSGLFFVWKVSK